LSLKDIKGGEALRKFVLDDLKRMQEMPLEDKITRTKLLIKEWYEYFDGKVAISFSGGKDSTVLLHIARQLYPDIPAIFCGTGLEYPEIREHVKTFDNVEWIKPKKTFKQVVLEYGYLWCPNVDKGGLGLNQVLNYMKIPH
jgi:3'-phosphoadenosine 5'-phosphosulfate sulfotransferase (PAPS reductase)/FAD synthetase